jgi:hypothetical protein
MTILITYLISFILFKFIVWLDAKFEVFMEIKYPSAWIETWSGRKKIYTILFLIPFFNVLSSALLSILIIILYLYNHTKFSLF